MSKSGRQRQKIRPSRRRRPGDPDEFVNSPFGYMARWGRLVELRRTVSDDEHAEMIDALVGGADEVRQELEVLRTRLVEILKEADPIDLVARASLTYLHIDPDTFKEWESDRSPAHVEYLALQALGLGLSGRNDVDPIREFELTWEAIDVVREMFKATSMLMTMEAIASRRDRPGDPMIEYRLKARLESLGVRGTGYAEHLIRVIHGCLDPFDRECRQSLGFTGTEALSLTHGIADLISDRIGPRRREARAGRSELLRQLKRERRHRSGGGLFPDWLLDLPPTQAKLQVSMLTTTWLFADSRSLALVTPRDLAAQSSVDESAARAFLDAFACSPDLFVEDHHALPGGAHPLTIRPILHVGDGYVVPASSSLLDAIRPRMEDLLQQTPIWERYADARARYLEREATELLASALPGSRSWTGIPWQTSDAGSDIDGLVTADDITLRIQCKSGRLTAPARRGAPDRMKHDVGHLIEAAAEQHRALATALEAKGAKTIGFSSDQAAAFEAAFQFEVVACLDDVAVWATEAHELRRLGGLPHDRPVPWVLSLTDLMAVVDLLQGAQLVHYLIRRHRIERDGRIEAHDELDWAGHYIAEGLFFDLYFESDQPPQALRLASYTEPIDAWYFTRQGVRTVEAPKPAQKIPRNLDWLIDRLEREQPRHWVMAAVALLDGDQESRDLWEKAIANARTRVPKVGWSNASQTFAGKLGVTLDIDLRTDWPEIRVQVADYCRAKAQEQKQPNWIAMGEGANGGLFVITIERAPGLPLAETFLNPPSGRGAARPSALDG